ncbi:MAG: hypothetical protein ACUVWR_11865 [Anaerolineae bacterium]
MTARTKILLVDDERPITANLALFLERYHASQPAREEPLLLNRPSSPVSGLPQLQCK